MKMETASSAPKISVCVVTYNHERFIRRCLESVLQQDIAFDVEIIVGDDCSTDGTGAIVDELAASDSRVRVHRPASNIGVTRNLLSVHRAARGEYVVHLDGDDFAYPGKISAQAAMLDENPHYAMCGHRMEVIDEGGAPTGNFYPYHLPVKFGLDKIIRCGMPIIASSVMYRKSSRSIENVDFEIFDWFFYTDIMTRGEAGYLDDALGAYRLNHGSLTSKLKLSGMMARMVDLYRSRKHRYEFAEAAVVTNDGVVVDASMAADVDAR